MISLSSVPSWKENVVSRVVDKETIMVLPDRGKIKVMNEVAGRICALIDGSHSAGQIAAEICQEFAVEQEQAETDTINFLQQLADSGIISAK